MIKKQFFYVFYRANDTVEGDGTVAELVTELNSNWTLLYRCEGGAKVEMTPEDNMLLSNGDNPVVSEVSTISFNVLPIGGDSGNLDAFAGTSTSISYDSTARFDSLRSNLDNVKIDLCLFNADRDNPYAVFYYGIFGKCFPNFVAGELARLNIEMDQSQGRFRTSDIDIHKFTIGNVGASPDEGAKSFPIDVTLSCPMGGVDTYYTTDGSTPDNTDTLYTDAITLTEASTLKAIAYKTGYTTSAVMTKTYTEA